MNRHRLFDPEMVGEVLELMKQLAREGMTMVSGNTRDGICKRGCKPCHVINDGVIQEENTPQEIFEHPQSPRLQEFLSKSIMIMKEKG